MVVKLYDMVDTRRDMATSRTKPPGHGRRTTLPEPAILCPTFCSQYLFQLTGQRSFQPLCQVSYLRPSGARSPPSRSVGSVSATPGETASTHCVLGRPVSAGPA